MNDYIIDKLLKIVEQGNSEIAAINALKRLESVDLDAYFKRQEEKKTSEQNTFETSTTNEEEALKLLE